MSLRRNLDRISGALDTVVKALCVILLTAMVVVVTLQIFSRYVMPKPLPWTEEVARFCMVWLAYLGASCLVRTWENTSVTFVMDNLGPRARFALDLAIKATMLVFMTALVVLSAQELPRFSLREKSPALMISMLIPKSSIIFGSFMMAVQLLWVLVDTLLARREKAA